MRTGRCEAERDGLDVYKRQELLCEHQIPFEIVPGITSAVSVPAYNGIPVTHRDCCSSLHIITGHTKKSEEAEVDYEALVKVGGDVYKRQGFTSVTLQPTHIINGDEYDKMVEQAMKFRKFFHTLKIGRPLLTESADYEAVCRAILKQFPKLKKEEALVLMGHGTGHFADSAYAALDYRFKALGADNVFVGTVEGYPEIEDVRRQLRAYGPRKVILLPLMRCV